MISVLCFIALPALSYNPYQLLFVEELTDYPRVIGQKLPYFDNCILLPLIPLITVWHLLVPLFVIVIVFHNLCIFVLLLPFSEFQTLSLIEELFSSTREALYNVGGLAPVFLPFFKICLHLFNPY